MIRGLLSCLSSTLLCAAPVGVVDEGGVLKGEEVPDDEVAFNAVGLGSCCWLAGAVELPILVAIIEFKDFKRSGFTRTLRNDEVFPVSDRDLSPGRNG